MFANKIFGMEIFVNFGYGYLIVHQTLMRSAFTEHFKLNNGRVQIFAQTNPKTLELYGNVVSYGLPVAIEYAFQMNFYAFLKFHMHTSIG